MKVSLLMLLLGPLTSDQFAERERAQACLTLVNNVLDLRPEILALAHRSNDLDLKDRLSQVMYDYEMSIWPSRLRLPTLYYLPEWVRSDAYEDVSNACHSAWGNDSSTGLTYLDYGRRATSLYMLHEMRSLRINRWQATLALIQAHCAQLGGKMMEYEGD